ncbi:hypothetical protein BKM31_13915 [[Actinomadura] parvosata subsp. kistnae]|uniref:Uncharacterized protein n=1 Tax=[Actinomadura] parvosata subsp. kistnae TaxID=1909395 RepID=A0A1U9ZWT5_9ACTN|nr:hypothetical protein BKM31_13915 [Nonomuraea sp. ATCC 55076]
MRSALGPAAVLGPAHAAVPGLAQDASARRPARSADTWENLADAASFDSLQSQELDHGGRQR